MWHFHPIGRPVSLTGLYTAFATEFTPDFVFRGESHDFYELVLVTKGAIGVTAGANSFVLEAPAAILHPPIEFHSIRSAQNTAPKIMIFSFGADALPDYKKNIFALSTENIAHAQSALDLLHKSTAMAGNLAGDVLEGKEKEAQLALLELEVLLLTLTEQGEPSPKKEGSAGGRNYRRALRIIEENLTLPLNTNDLARLCHMSPSLLKKTFARHAGVGVMEYFRTRKINAAIPLLREGVGVQEIATRLGFSNAGYFSTVFHRVTGKTPSFYRNH